MRHVYLFATERLKHVKVLQGRSGHSVAQDSMEVDDARQLHAAGIYLGEKVDHVSEDVRVKAVSVVEPECINKGDRVAFSNSKAIDTHVGSTDIR